jgi:hypothetical protein
MWWILAGLAIVLAWLILSRLRSYEKLFATSHLMEFGQALAALKRAAMQNMMTVLSPDDARVLQTSAGLALIYTINLDPDGRYIHHASVSIPGQVTTAAVGEMFILLWARLLGFGYERLVLDMSPATVHHAEFVLNESEQADFARRPVEAPTVDMLEAFQVECLRVRQNMRRDLSPAAAEP